MAADIAPTLLRQVQSTFNRTLAADRQAASLMRKLTDGKGKYSDAEEYADRVSKALAKAFDSHVTSATLPDGRMYWNIAERVLEPMFDDAYNLAADAAVIAQETLNKSAGIGLKAQRATLGTDELDNMFGKLCAANVYDDVAYVLNESADVMVHNAVTDTMRDNADFQSGCGMHPKIVRKVGASGCCETCSALAGEYDYSKDMAREVFWRHSHCKCTVDYYPDDGSRRVQNAHTKEWRDEDAIEERKVYAGLDTTAKVDKENLKTAYLGAGNSSNATKGTPYIIGNIDVEKIDEAVAYFNEQIRYRSEETAVIIDKYGTVWQSNGGASTVAINGIILDGAIITHNHPASNGIVSFSEDDINFLKAYHSIKELVAVNEKYTYTVTNIKDLENMSYSEYYREAIKNHSLTDNEDLQHETLELISQDGYLQYVRKEIK